MECNRISKKLGDFPVKNFNKSIQTRKKHPLDAFVFFIVIHYVYNMLCILMRNSINI